MNIPEEREEDKTLPASLKEAPEELNFEGSDHLLLACPRCNHLISAAEIDIQKTIARCSHCHHVFGFAHDSATGNLKAEQIIPEGVEVLKLRSELDIRLNWAKTVSSGGRKFMILFTTMWNLILLPFVLTIMMTGQWGILLFLSLHLAVGLGLLWYLAGIYINKTSISITPRRIKVQTVPLKNPLHKTKDLETQDIKQLYVSKYTESTSNGVPNYAYALYAIMNDGEKVSLVRGMNKETQRYVEREIEGYLGIKNLKVEEETS